MKIKNIKKGFTLLELLVVVLIIGILAAIALPQYQMAVGKAKFSTLKDITKSIQQSAQRYFIANNTYPRSVSGLDVNLNLKKEIDLSWGGLEMTMKDGIVCILWLNTINNQIKYVNCSRNIFNEKVALYINRETGQPILCSIFGTEDNPPNAKGPASRLCAKETGKPIVNTCDNVCHYSY